MEHGPFIDDARGHRYQWVNQPPPCHCVKKIANNNPIQWRIEQSNHDMGISWRYSVTGKYIILCLWYFLKYWIFICYIYIWSLLLFFNLLHSQRYGGACGKKMWDAQNGSSKMEHDCKPLNFRVSIFRPKPWTNKLCNHNIATTLPWLMVGRRDHHRIGLRLIWSDLLSWCIIIMFAFEY